MKTEPQTSIESADEIRPHCPICVMPSTAPEDTLDIEGAAVLFKCSRKAVGEMADKGEIPAIRLAGKWLFVRAQLMEYLIKRAKSEQAKRMEEEIAKTSGILKEFKPESMRGRHSRRSNKVDISQLEQ